MVVYLGKATPASGTGGGGSGDAVWGSITGTLSDQTDLQTALNAKANSADLATVATTGAYSDLNGTPTIPTTTDSVTQGSTAALTSGGAYTALSAKLENTATGTNSLSIGGTATSAGNATNIGATSNVTGNYSTALGYGAGVTSGATRAIQIGEGTNSTSNTLSIGFGANNYRLLDGSTGKIPNDRLGAFTGATSLASGTTGGVPAPTTSDVGKFLSADGTWATAGGSVDIDESTITENAQNKLQAVGVVNQNTANGATNPLKLWEGTEAEYNNGGAVKDTYYNWMYLNAQQPTITGYASTISSSCYGDKFVLIGGSIGSWGYADTALYSSDGGETWDSATLPDNQQWVGAAYGNGKYVTLAYNTSTAAYSSDGGATWNSASLPSSAKWCDVAYGDGKFIAINENGLGKGAVSTDGQNWSEITLPAQALGKIIYADGKFVIKAGTRFSGTSSNKVYFSSDGGVTWVESTLPASSAYSWLCAGDGKIICNSYITSNNGQTWQSISISDGVTAFSNGCFLNVNRQNGAVKYSVDGLTWKNGPSITNKYYETITADDNGHFVSGMRDTGLIIDIKRAYTLEAEPTTASTVYSAPEVTSALTITSVDTGEITLSDTNTYTYNAGGNAYSYYTVAETYPTWLCNIEGVGVKIGSTLIADATGNVLPTQTGNSGKFLTTNGTDASWGTVESLPSQSGNSGKFLTTDGTTASWATVSSGGLQNTALGTDCLTILGTPIASGIYGSINIGSGTEAGEHSVAIGSYDGGSPANVGDLTVAIGCDVGDVGDNAVVINGFGTQAQNCIAINTTAKNYTFTVGDRGGNDYDLLDLSTGKIPTARIGGATGSFTTNDGKTVTVTDGVITSIV